MNVTGSDVALVLIGVFYVFAGVVSMRAAAASIVLDAAIAAIEGRPDAASTSSRERLLVVLGVSVLAAGAALALRLELAAALFSAALVLQVVYLSLLAPLWLDKNDPPSPSGRSQTFNAAVVFAFATAFVLWAYASGRLLPMSAVPPILLGLTVIAVVVFVVHALWRVRP